MWVVQHMRLSVLHADIMCRCHLHRHGSGLVRAPMVLLFSSFTWVLGTFLAVAVGVSPPLGSTLEGGKQCNRK